ncbi:MAG: methyltransferase [Xanthomonadales bacterium]|nr:methyltransferase [Xanthomonadales bacterium]NIN59026.1 methyltransferase [Xanthomonadales bacterium]NIN74956.1 methyltransferase [Xanthomonadales bacterium]NIO13373.1 methyltransferase [Xanthomonadales bacterium]NIP11419.1 methyltransferase [Xanthomonadales bacterium]
MTPVSQLLARNADRLRDTAPLLWFNPPADMLALALTVPGGDGRAHTQDYGDWQRLARAGVEATFGAAPPEGEGPWPAIVLTLPREKQRLEMLLHCAAERLEPGGVLWLAGENRSGIKSAASPLRKRFGAVVKVDSARHCALFAARQPLQGQPFLLADYEQTWPLVMDELELEVCSLPGVFAHGRLDPGTRLLLEVLLEREIAGEVLDFGCGAGAIGLVLKHRNPGARVTLLDRSALALQAAARTCELNGLQARILPGDGFTGLHGTFDLIVSNPPFHRGRQAEPRLTPQLLEPARNFLAPGGQLVLVANRHLPYRRWLEQACGHYHVLRENSRYQVLASGRGR